MKERTLENLRNSLKGKVHVYLRDDETRRLFLSDAASEGYRFGSCGLPETVADSIIALGRNRQLSYVGCFGRIAFQCNGGSGSNGNYHRIDYARYKRGDKKYHYSPDPYVCGEKLRSLFHGTVGILGDDCGNAERFYLAASKRIKSYDEEEELFDLISKKYNVIVADEND